MEFYLYQARYVPDNLKDDITRLSSFIWTSQQVKDLSRNKFNYFYLMLENNHLLGLVNYQEIAGEYDLNLIVVDEDFRGQGLGEKLLKSWLNSLNSPSRVYLEVKSTNLPARKLYEKLSFRIIGRRKNYYQDKSDAVVMVYEKKE